MSIAMAEEVINEVAAEATQAAAQATGDRLTLNIGENLLDAVLGYLVVFIGLTLLMAVVIAVGKIMTAKAKKSARCGIRTGPRARRCRADGSEEAGSRERRRCEDL